MSKQTVRTPQRIVKLVRYLESVLDNEKAPERLRMQAAERLCELFLEAERGKRERVIAIARAESRARQSADEKAGTGTSETPDESTDAIAQAEKAQKEKAIWESVTRTRDEYLSKTLGTR